MPCVARLERGLEVAREGAPAALIQLLGKVIILAPNLWVSVGKREGGGKDSCFRPVLLQIATSHAASGSTSRPLSLSLRRDYSSRPPSSYLLEGIEHRLPHS